MSFHSACLAGALIGVGLVGLAATGCELLVTLDRSAVDAGEAGCPICADAAADGGDAEASSQATARDADAGPEAPGDAGQDRGG